MEMLFNITFVPMGEDGRSGGSAGYGIFAETKAEAIAKAVRAEVKNRFTYQAACGNPPFIREFRSAELSEYWQKRLAEMQK